MCALCHTAPAYFYLSLSVTALKNRGPREGTINTLFPIYTHCVPLCSSGLRAQDASPSLSRSSLPMSEDFTLSSIYFTLSLLSFSPFPLWSSLCPTDKIKQFLPYRKILRGLCLAQPMPTLPASPSAVMPMCGVARNSLYFSPSFGTRDNLSPGLTTWYK